MMNNIGLKGLKIPGPRSLELLKRQTNLETGTITYTDSFPIAIKRASGSVIEDMDGNKYIDWVSGISVLNLGYNEEIISAVANQMSSIWHALEIPTEARINFMETLKKTFPKNMQNYKIMFGISGADACETAINIAHAVHGGKGSTIAFEGAYHGVSGGIISATAGNKYRAGSYSSGFNIIRVPYPYKFTPNSDVSDIMALMKRIFLDPESGYSHPDSIIVEPILGEGGYVVPPPGFLRAIREFCDEFDLTMIVDEVQTGVGHTGKMWAFEWDNVQPDIVCISKSIGGGIPVSVIYYRDDYDNLLSKPFHLGTYRANPLALAAGTVVMKTVPRYFERVKEDGRFIIDSFKKIDSPLIADVRGKGFMVGVELYHGNSPLDGKTMMNIKHELLYNGLLMHTCGHFSNVFRFMGALNIPDNELREGIKIFSQVLLSGNFKADGQ